MIREGEKKEEEKEKIEPTIENSFNFKVDVNYKLLMNLLLILSALCIVSHVVEVTLDLEESNSHRLEQLHGSTNFLVNFHFIMFCFLKMSFK